MGPIVDIGVNLMHRSYSQDRDQVVKDAQQAGVTPLLITGTDIRSSKNAAAYAARYPGQLYSTAGVHPHDTKNCEKDTVAQIKLLAAKKQVAAIGECGLDYDRNFSPPYVQREWFEKQVQLAEELAMPLFLHERCAHQDMLTILKRHPEAAKRSVVHCFTGTAVEALAYLELGCYIGVTGWICDNRRAQSLRDAVKVIPSERLLIETDAPFLTPRDLPEPPLDRRNEPQYLPHILKRIAFYMDCDPTELAKQIRENTKQLFGM